MNLIFVLSHLLLHFLELLESLTLLDDQVVLLFFILFKEGIEQDGQEEVQQNEVSNEDPSDVDSADPELVHIVVTECAEQDYLPIFESQHLKDGNESDCNRIVIVSRCSFWIIFENSSKSLHSKQSENEDEKEHKSSNVKKRLVRSLNHTQNRLH
jgi:hypothetical protein